MTGQLIHGDCLTELTRVPDGSVDLVFADLPYAHMQGGKVRNATANKWDVPIDLDALWAQLLRVGKRNAAFVFTATQPFATTLINSQSKLFRYDLVWVRGNPTGFLQAKKMPLRNIEAVLVFYRLRPSYNPQMTYGHSPYKKTATATTDGSTFGTGRLTTKAVENDGSRYPTAVLQISEAELRGAWGNSKRLHPTQKPVALIEWLIRTYSNEGDTILDPTAGSMTTAVAAINTGRKYVCIEKDAEYYRIGCERVGQPVTSSPAAPHAQPSPRQMRLWA